MDRIAESVKLACEIHAGQVDKAGEPYILHCLEVMLQTSKHVNSRVDKELILCAAVLHDSIEDTKDLVHTLEEINRIGGNGLLYYIGYLTRIPGENYNQYIDKICRSAVCALIKKQDLKHNMNLNRFPLLIEREDKKNISRRNYYLKAYHRIEKSYERV